MVFTILILLLLLLLKYVAAAVVAVAAGTPGVGVATLAFVHPGNRDSSKSGRPLLMVGREELGKAQQLPVALHLLTFQHQSFTFLLSHLPTSPFYLLSFSS